MGKEPLSTLWQLWQQEKLPPETAVGQLLQHALDLEATIARLTKTISELRTMISQLRAEVEALRQEIGKK